MGNQETSSPFSGKALQSHGSDRLNLLFHCPKPLTQTALGCMESEANRWDSPDLAMDQQ